MNIEKIEEFYQKENEKAKQIFLKAWKDPQDRKNAEKNYQKRLHAIRERYSKDITSYLKEQKKLKKKEKKPKKEKKEQFKAQEAPKSIGFMEKLKLKIDLLKFKTSIKLKKAYDNHYPASLKYFAIKSGKKLKRAQERTYRIIKALFSDIGELFKRVIEFFKEKFKSRKKSSANSKESTQNPEAKIEENQPNLNQNKDTNQ